MSSRRSRMTRTGGSLFAAVALSSVIGATTALATTVPSGSGPSGSEPSGSAATAGAAAGADLTGKVFYLLPNATTPRYTNYDAPEFIAAMAEYAPGVEVVTLNAEGDPQKQVPHRSPACTRRWPTGCSRPWGRAPAGCAASTTR